MILSTILGGFRGGSQLAESTGLQLDFRSPGIHPGVPHTSRCYCVIISGCALASSRVASQNFRPVAGVVPRLARQHTDIARKEPRFQELR